MHSLEDTMSQDWLPSKLMQGFLTSQMSNFP